MNTKIKTQNVTVVELENGLVELQSNDETALLNAVAELEALGLVEVVNATNTVVMGEKTQALKVLGVN